MAQFTIDEAKTNLSQLITKALQGGEVIITLGSIPAVRLVPVAPTGNRCFGALRGKIAIDGRFDEPWPDDELDCWNR